ncbi:hypothetical protein BDN72DRAFT_775918, partial [Pluteus cervinus]
TITFYEPFYDLDRFFDEAVAPTFRGHHRIQCAQDQGTSNGAIRSLKPKMDLHEDTSSPQLPQGVKVKNLESS